MFTIKTVGRVLPQKPERPEDADPKIWFPRRWAGATTEWWAGFEHVMDLGAFSIEAEEPPWVAAREAFDWLPDHGFERVVVGEFQESDRVGHALIGHQPGRSFVFINPTDVSVYILGDNGQTVDRL